VEEKTTSTESTWQVDADVLKCNGCQKSFSFWVRRHHCRNCGKIFCSECTAFEGLVNRPNISSFELVRLCQPCYEQEQHTPQIEYVPNSIWLH